MEEVAADFGGRAVVAKVDVDIAGSTAAKYGVEYLPTLIVFKNGKEVARRVGGGKQELVALLNQAFSE